MFDYIIRCLRISFNSICNWRSSGCNSMSTRGKIIGDCNTGDPLHSRALAHSRAPLFTQPCPHCSHSRAPGEQWARLCVFTLQGCVQAARLCRGSPVCKWEMQRSLSRNIERNFYNIATSTMGESHYRLGLSTLLFVSYKCTKYDIPFYIYERENNNCLSGSDYNLFYRQDQVLKLWECFQPKNGWYKLHWARIGSSIVVFEKKACDQQEVFETTVQKLYSLQWRHSERWCLSHQPKECLLNRLFRRRSKKTSKLRVTGLCEGNSPVTGEFPAKGL